MVRLEFTKEECIALRGILERDASELHRELADTDNWKFKAGLKEREALLKKILDKVEAAQTEAAKTDDIVL